MARDVQFFEWVKGGMERDPEHFRESIANFRHNYDFFISELEAMAEEYKEKVVASKEVLPFEADTEVLFAFVHAFLRNARADFRAETQQIEVYMNQAARDLNKENL
jgi:hypothetical protein